MNLVTHPTFLASSRTIPTILPAATIAPALTWDVYLSQLNAWETELFEHITILLDLEALLHLFQSKHQVYLASDGGKSDPLGSYGCLLISKSSILVENGSQANDTNPCSFQAKGYDMLTIL
jgi:hypothetical protein